MKKPVIAVYLCDVGLMLIEAGAVSQATVQSWLQSLDTQTVTRYATTLEVEPGVNGHGSLLVVADYGEEQTGVSWPGPDTGRLQEVYRYQGAYLVLESNDCTEE